MTENRIVVGVDASPEAMHALAWAMNEAELCGGSVTAVHQYHYPWAPAPIGFLDAPPTEADLQREAAKTMRNVVDEVVTAGGWAHEPDLQLRFGPSASHILCQEAEGCGLLVVGQRGGGGFLGLRLGSVSERCLHHATTPLAIIPESSPDVEPLRRVTVGVDGSEASAPAIRWAVDEGERLGVPVSALMAWTWLGPVVPELQPSSGWNADSARELLGRTVRAATSAELDLEVVHSRPSRALIERSAAGDLVVVAAKGTSTVASLLAGSVSRQLAHHATAPIVVVR